MFGYKNPIGIDRAPGLIRTRDASAVNTHDGARRPEHIARANAKRSADRSAVEHVFAGQKHRMVLFIRTIGIARARIKIGMVNLASHVQRRAWLEGRGAHA